MFSKTNDQTLPVNALQTSSGFSKSVLAADLAITGEVISSSAIEVLGKIDGKITAKSLTVGVEGRVKGSISADNVDLRGTFDGTIATQSTNLTKRISEYKDELTKLEDRMTKLLERYNSQFGAMESIVGQSKSLRTSLTSTFDGMMASYTKG